MSAATGSSRSPVEKRYARRLARLVVTAIVLVGIRVALHPLLTSEEATGIDPGVPTLGRLQELETRVKREPGNAAAHYELAMFFGKNRAYLDAADAFQEALKHGADTAELHHHLGSALQQLSRHDEAILAHRNSVRKSPERLGYHLSLARAYLDAGRADLAEQVLDRIPPGAYEAEVAPEAGSTAGAAVGGALGQIAGLYGACGQYPKALRLLKRAVTLAPGDPALWALLGKAHTMVGEPAAAVMPLRQSLNLRGDVADSHYLLGAALIQTGDPERLSGARRSLETTIRLAPDHAHAYFQLGKVMTRLGQHGAAANAFYRAYQNDFSSVPALSALASALRRAKEEEKALYYQGLADEASDRLEQALRAFEKLVGTSQTTTAYVKMAGIYQKLGKHRDQLRCTEKAAASEPQDADLQRRLAQANLAVGNGDRFESLMLKAAELDPTTADVSWRELGAYYLSRGRQDEAEAYFRKCIDKQPRNGAYLYALEVVSKRG